MLTDRELLLLQRQALYRLNQHGQLLSSNDLGFPPAPQLFLGRTRNGNIWSLRHDLLPELAREAQLLLEREPVATDLRQPLTILPQLRRLFVRPDHSESLWQGPAFYAAVALSAPDNTRQLTIEDAATLAAAFGNPQELLCDRQPCVAALLHGQVVSICFSARSIPEAAEAGVMTLPAYRGRGFASAAVAGWIAALQSESRLALYSTSWGNRASQGVARRLGLQLYGEDLSL